MDEYISTKKRKIIDKIGGGIMSTPPKCIDRLISLSGTLLFSCQSRDNSQIHQISMISKDNKFLIECDCTGGFNGEKCQNCVHINTTLIYLCRQYVENACEFSQKKQNYIDTKSTLNKLSDELDKLLV